MGRPKGSKNKKKKLVILQKENLYTDISPVPQRRLSGGTFKFSNPTPTLQYHHQLAETLDPKKGRGRPPKFKPLKRTEPLYTDIAPTPPPKGNEIIGGLNIIQDEGLCGNEIKDEGLCGNDLTVALTGLLEMLQNEDPPTSSDEETDEEGVTQDDETDDETDEDQDPVTIGMIDGREYYIGESGKIYDMETEEEIPQLFGRKENSLDADGGYEDSEDDGREVGVSTGMIDGKEYYIGESGKVYDMETEKEIPHLFGKLEDPIYPWQSR